jgi:RNA polymerase II transcription elongation factor
LPDNHKPTLPSETALSGHELKPAVHGDAAQYDLSFSDGSGKYEYQGIRNSGDGQYALVFDPVKKHFVLHQVDSTFDMNLTSTPWNQDPTSLRETYSQIQTQSSPKLRRKSSQTKPKTAQSSRTSADAKRRKVEKAKKAKSPPKEPTPDAEDEDSDDGLTIEYPGGAPPPRYQSHPSPLPFRREQEEPSEESDADAEDEEHDDNERNMDVDILELPSPAANIRTSVVEDEEEEDELEQALAAELEEALEKHTGPKADESSESEEE